MVTARSIYLSLLSSQSFVVLIRSRLTYELTDSPKYRGTGRASSRLGVNKAKLNLMRYTTISIIEFKIVPAFTNRLHTSKLGFHLIGRAVRHARSTAMTESILFSSPALPIIPKTPSRGLVAPMSSSPELPSPSELLSKGKSISPTGNSANALPDRICLGFAKASSLLRQMHSADKITRLSPDNIEAHLLPASKPLESLTTKKRGQKVVRASEPESTTAAKPKALLGKPTTIKTGTVSKEAAGVQEGEPSGAAKAKTSRVAKRRNAAQTTIKKVKITKPMSARSRRKPSHIEKAQSSLSTAIAETEKPEEQPENELPATLADPVVNVVDKAIIHNKKAVARKRGWTPVDDTPIGDNDLVVSVAKIPSSEIEGVITKNTRKTGFETLLNDYGCVQSIDVSPGLKHVRNNHGEATTKKRKLEVRRTKEAVFG